MPIESKENFKQVIKNALSEAELIVDMVRRDPMVYVSQRIDEFANIYSKYFTRVSDDILTDITARTGKTDFPSLAAWELGGEATGSSVGGEAVLFQIERIKTQLADFRIDEAYDSYAQVQSYGLMFSIFQRTWRAAVVEFATLFNTMKLHMDQGAAPKPVPGPGQHVVHTPFGDTIVDDTPLEKMLVGQITVAQLRQILADAGKK